MIKESEEILVIARQGTAQDRTLLTSEILGQPSLLRTMTSLRREIHAAVGPETGRWLSIEATK